MVARCEEAALRGAKWLLGVQRVVEECRAVARCADSAWRGVEVHGGCRAVARCMKDVQRVCRVYRGAHSGC